MQYFELQSLQYEQNRGEFGLDSELSFDRHLKKLQTTKEYCGVAGSFDESMFYFKYNFWYGYKSSLLDTKRQACLNLTELDTEI